MSDTTTEKETEVVVGTIDSVVKKREDTWQVVVKPDGSQYSKNLWTKSTSLVAEADAALGQRRVFECNVSYWKRNDGTEVRSLWLEKMSANDDGEQADLAAANASPRSAAPRSTGGGNEMSKEDWARKDSAIHMMAAIKAAADALKHTLPSEPSDKDLRDYIERVKFLSYNWWQRADAVRKGDDSDVPSEAGRPALSEHDDSIPF